MTKKFVVVITCWDFDCPPYSERESQMYDSFNEAFEEIKRNVKNELICLNDLESDTPREKVAIEDSDGNIVGYDYPFRADFDGDNHCIIRFWDGDDYQNVTAYNIYGFEDWCGYYIYRTFEIYPNKNQNRFRVTDKHDCFGTVKYKLEAALDWIDDWLLGIGKHANLLLHHTSVNN